MKNSYYEEFKNNTLKIQQSEIIVQSKNKILIDNRPYIIVKNYRNAFELEVLQERFSDILTKYDYIVGDWGYNQLRLRGFYKSDSKNGYPTQKIDYLEDYLYEYCNFGCSYFVLYNVEAQKPKKILDEFKKKHRKTLKKHIHNKKVLDRPYFYEEKYEIRNIRNRELVYSKVKRKQQSSKRHFTIRQKG